MKLMICGNVFGDFETLKKDADFIQADYILICGNVGIKQDTSFIDYWDGRLPISQPIYFVTGKYEDFGLVKQIMKSLQSIGGPFICSVDCLGKTKIDGVKIAGVSGTYSEKYYKEPISPPRHMRKSSMDFVPQDLDIIMLHNVPGKLGKQNGLNFDLEFHHFLREKRARYVFVGGYGLPTLSFFPSGGSTVLFLPPLDKGYAIIDTDSWSCYFNNKME